MVVCCLFSYEYVKEEKEKNATKYREALLATIKDYLLRHILILQTIKD